MSEVDLTVRTTCLNCDEPVEFHVAGPYAELRFMQNGSAENSATCTLAVETGHRCPSSTVERLAAEYRAVGRVL